MRTAWVVFVLVAGGFCGSALAQGGTSDAAALSAVTQDLCSREVAMLGEASNHKNGHTEEFKVALVERLVNECGFDAVYFEASHAEFIHIARRLRLRQPVAEDQVAAAVGGLWKFDREFQPLVPFLLAKAQAGQISLGGIDDQSGGLGQSYANDEFVGEVTGFLPEAQGQSCNQAMHHRVYTDDEHPYTEADRSQVALCVSAAQVAVASNKKTDPAAKEELLEMISAFGRWSRRDIGRGVKYMVGRDRSMFENFEWLRKQKPMRHKVIVWAATVHLAKSGSGISPDFGSYVEKAYGDRAFSLGFSALGGSYGEGRIAVKQLPAVPSDSLEERTLLGSDAGAEYLGLAKLQALGTVPCAAFHHAYETLPWGSVLDGLVVFRVERPPVSTR